MTPRGPALRTTSSPEETEELARALAPRLRPGDVISLQGPLGAGKTRFVQGLARGLSRPGRVRSPSFTLVNEYGGEPPLLHLDLYRLGPQDVQGLGLEERLDEAVLAVEWGEKLLSPLGDDALEIRFEILSERERALTATGIGARGEELLLVWSALATAPESSR